MSLLKFQNNSNLKNINNEIHSSIEIGCRLRYGRTSTELMKQCMFVLKNVNSQSNEELAEGLIGLLQFGVTV